MMQINRRAWLATAAGGTFAAGSISAAENLQTEALQTRDLQITGLRITPIALPDPPLLNAAGCHAPHFLRNIVELETNDGIAGIGETRGGKSITEGLEKARKIVVGQSAFAYRKFAAELMKLNNPVYAGVELACLDAIGRATGLRLCELIGGPLREEVEFAAYLFYRYAADHPVILADERLADGRGRGEKSLDSWGEVRTPDAMAEHAWSFHKKWGFRVQKLKGGVLPPDIELDTMRALNAKFRGEVPLRIDPNGRWTVETALRIGKHLQDLPLDYYEDPVRGQADMATVRQRSGLPMSTNMCVTRLEHIPEAVTTGPVDVVLGDHHGWGGIAAFQTLGNLAPAMGWGISQHSNSHGGVTMAAMIHLGASIPQLNYASDTHYPHLVEGADIIQGPNLKFQAGKMKVPTGPGIGVKLDRDKLAKAHEVFKKCGIEKREDENLMRQLEPGWERTVF